MRSQRLLNIRNKEIYEAYAELWGQGLREELIWPKLVLRFHLETKTIYRICLAKTKEVRKVQLELFPDENTEIQNNNS